MRQQMEAEFKEAGIDYAYYPENPREATAICTSWQTDMDERGGGLSGGERRRLGLARAFLKDSPIMLLDEPTANLDREAEEAMIETIRRAAAGRTTLIATHSAAVAAIADRVVRL